MKISIYGTGCKNCLNLAKNAKMAAEELGLDFEMEKVEDMTEIAKAGVMSTPALAIDGEIKAKGIVLSKEDIKDLLQ
ncbi:thioredoxin family protein [Natronospora cellulosivora (SeqCode)]